MPAFGHTPHHTCCFEIILMGLTGRTGGFPVLIGVAPPPILMAGRSHCLRRFFRARTVTKRKFHYIQILAAGPPLSIGRCPACGAGVYRSVSYALGKRSLPSWLETSWRARRPAPCMPLLAACVRFAIFSFQGSPEGGKVCPSKTISFLRI